MRVVISRSSRRLVVSAHSAVNAGTIMRTSDTCRARATQVTGRVTSSRLTRRRPEFRGSGRSVYLEGMVVGLVPAAPPYPGERVLFFTMKPIGEDRPSEFIYRGSACSPS